jgi:hypothetical protein
MPSEDDEWPTLEFSFSGVAEGEEGDLPEFSLEVVQTLNHDRRDIANQIKREIIDLLSEERFPLREIRLRGTVEVDIRFHTGSLWWDGWVAVRDFFSHSYLADTPIGDLAIIVGLWPVIDSFRKRLGRRIDSVVGERIEQAHHSRRTVRPRTRAVTANSGMALGAILRSIDRLERQISRTNDDLEQKFQALEKELRYRFRLSVLAAALFVQTALIAALCLAVYWYITHH